ncbi:MAG: hypothetical protein A2000_01725 [Ignavibacteria bacterium GWB2_36_8]|nr:MAG: hypothetical protein A2000_01725 [Ignavibacteria bacterium GWB2_36_8]OGU48612.1 MAG: hypothetical protein A2080_13020 [Ignavibacteria bacterium GWC2_36_12]
MKKNKPGEDSGNIFSRRKFLRTLGSTTAGLLVAPYIKSQNILGYGHEGNSQYISQVGVTRHDNYNRAEIKQKVQHLFDAMGGIQDVVSAGDKVAIKINLTGGSGSANDPRLQGVDITECMWTHPEVVRAVGELLIDSGVNGNDIYIVEALWDAESYNNFGYLDVQQNLGAQMVNLNNKEPYPDFVNKEVGENHFFYENFIFNQILVDVDVYVSIPKMKQHYDAGVTHSLKNQFGTVPIQFYMMPSQQGFRSKLHYEGGNIRTHLPRSVCDLNLARPVNLAVIDGIKNAVGGEGAWNPTFEPAEYDILLAGKDPVAADSIASFIMGNDPESEKLQLPNGEECDNYLELLHQVGVGTNRMNEIELVGDGAGTVSVRHDYKLIKPDKFMLFQNFPNPFNPSTTIKFYLPTNELVTIKLFNIMGEKIETLVEGNIPSGQHEIQWNANHLASGTYIYRMQAGEFSESRKMILQK